MKSLKILCFVFYIRRSSNEIDLKILTQKGEEGVGGGGGVASLGFSSFGGKSVK